MPAILAGAGVVLVLLLGITLFAFTRTTWEDQHRAAILAMKSDADGSLTRNQPREAYYQYQGLFSFVGDHKITSKFVRGELDEARELMDQAYVRAKPIIDEEAARERARLENLRRQEEQRQLAAAAETQRQERQRRDAEAARQAGARRQAAEAAATMRRAAELARLAADQGRRRAAFLASPEYAAYKRQADGIVSTLAVAVSSEDSAYRSISERSDAARRLLGIYVKVQGALNNANVAADVDRLLARADLQAVGEDSAIRAIANYDQTFFDLLGIWCRVLGTRFPKLPSDFSQESSSVRLRLTGDDSAVREISGYTRASMEVLGSILTAEGHDAEAGALVASAHSLDAGDDSAWRNAMHHSEAIMGLLLELLAKDHPEEARRIKGPIVGTAAGDDSALRAQSQYTQGTVEALQQLIRNE